MADFCAQLVPVEQDRFEAILLMSWRHTLLLDHSHDMSAIVESTGLIYNESEFQYLHCLEERSTGCHN